MKPARTIVVSVIIVFVLIVASSTVYTISETQQAVITQMGKPVKIIVGSTRPGEIDEDALVRVQAWNEQQPKQVTVTAGAGLRVKTPFTQSLKVFEDRVLENDSAPTDVVTKDKKHMVVDNYATWRIHNPLLFLQTVRTENGAQARLDDIIYSVIREHLGRNDLVEIVRSSNDPIQTTERHEFEPIKKGREEIMKEITFLANEKAEEYGIELLDVRIKRADLPEENAQHVYGRMRAERERIAKKYRSEGEEEARKIRAETDKQRKIILADAYKKAEKIKGDGDAKAIRIYAEAYSKDPEFFRLFRTLEAYPEVFGGPQKTKFIMTTDSEFNKYLKTPED